MEEIVVIETDRLILRPTQSRDADDRFKLVIFDLDGTLLDSVDDLAASVNFALAKHGYPQHEQAAYRFFVGNGITKLIERALPETARNKSIITTVRESFVDYYDHHKTVFTHQYPGITQMLTQLQTHGVEIAVASNKYHRATLELIGTYFGEFTFRAIYGQREGVAVKPDPRIIDDILTIARVTRSETLYVGDSGVDMQTARNGELTSVGVTWGFRSRTELEQNGADFIVDNAMEVVDIALKHRHIANH